MTLSFALYGGVFTGIEAQYSVLFRFVSMMIALVSLVWPGSIFFRGAWAALRTRTAHLDLPIALGLIAGGVAGTVNVVLDRGEVYFDSLTMLVFLLLVGRWIQRRQQRWAADAVELLFSLTPSFARRIEGDGVAEVPVEALTPGDAVEIRAGECVPTDGVVLEGRSSIDQSLLSGESRPRRVEPGDEIHAGTANLGACVRVRVEAVGDRTRVGRLMQLVEQCSRQRAPIVRFADRVAGWFVVVVLSLAVITFGLWLWLDAGRAVDHAVALLIVTCPCALGLATPLAVTIALGRAARRRILVKGGSALELLARRGTILLDKTGTLTAGRAAVVSFVGDEDVRSLVAALETHSSHPLARALVEAFGDDASASVADVEQSTGGGLVGTVDGHRLIVGSPKFVRCRDVEVPGDMDTAQRDTVGRGLTPVLAAVDGRCVAVIGLGDPIRDDAADALRSLKDLGWQPRILSGDHADVVRAVGRTLGIAEEDAIGNAAPEEKVAYVRAAAETEPVVMVGDGINDAAALSAATVGVAVQGGAEASLAAADVYLDQPGLTPIVELMHASRRTVRTIHRSLAVSLCYNAVAASLAVAGVIGPLVAAILMPISSFTVLALAYTSRTFEGGR
jgi:Cu2+-exporting ATPase